MSEREAIVALCGYVAEIASRLQAEPRIAIEYTDLMDRIANFKQSLEAEPK